MITPTQAQIEAARLAIAKIQRCALPCACYRNPQPEDCMTMATVALTAAAEVKEPQTSSEYHQRRGVAWDIIEQAIGDYDAFMLDGEYDAQDALNKIIAKMKERRSFYLTAAAEAGEQFGCGYDNPDDVCMMHLPVIKRHVAATIERCAQYVEAKGHHILAAEIRAMKDKT